MKLTQLGLIALMSMLPQLFLAGGKVQLTENDSGRTIELNLGDEVAILLPANPTTGYLWENGLPNRGGLEALNKEFSLADKTRGSGGIEFIKMTAKQPGKHKLRLIYHRPFEKKAPLKTFEVTFIIKSD